MKVLEVCIDLDGGGVDRYLYNYCSRIKEIEFDFAMVDSKQDGIIEIALKELGYNIFRVPRLSNGIRSNYKALKKIMTQNHYDAVHVHLGYKGFVALYCAKKCNIKRRIVHSHLANVPESKTEKIVRFFLTLISKYLATDFAACGVAAAQWMWGTKAYKKGLVTVQNNAIDTKQYAYDPQINLEYRHIFKIKNESLVVGHVGRISDQKNQLRLINIFNAIHKQQPDSYLVLIGRDELNGKVMEAVNAMNLSKYVFMLGVRNDVPRLLNMMDVFVFPSKYEGLPFTLIETQCNGLMALSSDVVTPQVKVTDCVKFLSLNNTDEQWAKCAIEISKYGHLSDSRELVVQAGYDINIEAEKLKEFYQKNS